MRIAAKIVLAQVALVLAAGAVAAVMLTTVRGSKSVMREISDSYEQTLTVQTIAQMADKYAEQIAELIILGLDPTEAEAARDTLLATIGKMEAQVEDEIAELQEIGDIDEIAEENQELERMRSLRGAVVRLEEARLRLMGALGGGNRALAVEIYSNEIEEGLGAVLDRLAEESVARERLEVTAALAQSRASASRLLWIAGFLALAALVGAAVLSMFLHRSVLRPIGRLSEGVRAVTAGDLATSVGDNRRDEFGEVGRGFDHMAARIAAQRNALIDARQDLERQVAERTEALSEALRHLEVQSEQRSRFLADISHELRTPLTVLRGRAEVALADSQTDADGMRQVLKRIVHTSNHLGRLVEDLLFLARSEAGVIPIERGPVVLQDVLADALLDSRELASRKQIFLLPRQPAEPLIVEGDGDRLRQALLIPLDNAVEAAPEGSTVSVTLERTDDTAIMAVADEGPGFSEEEIAIPARRFRKGRGRGTGLGLSIASWIMEGHGGALRIANGTDGGAVVRLELPVVKS
ncbi:ATP-binding protein [Actibacterium ureilyticum]|uniref:ATP-binding protein n=1 Tax=Actibacterium ureilyticum TaxID=1590614 RepID=UPI000BAB2215|nr:ATP-binding protein [Actibacterium ureilyticum]